MADACAAFYVALAELREQGLNVKYVVEVDGQYVSSDPNTSLGVYLEEHVVH